MAGLLNHFWLLGVLTNVANAAIWWLRGKKERERDPSLTDSYRSLCLGLLVFGSVPWIVMGAGIVFGGVPSVFHYLNPKTSNPFIGAFFLCWVVLAVLGTYWLLARGGAELLARHPGLFQRHMSNPSDIKLIWLIGLAGGAMTVVAMYFGAFRIPNLDDFSAPER